MNEAVAEAYEQADKDYMAYLDARLRFLASSARATAMRDEYAAAEESDATQ